MAAGRHEAAADEHRRGDLIELRQLADRVEDHRVGARLGVDRQLAAAHRGQPFALAQPLDFGEPLRMPRGEDQQRVAARRVVRTRLNARITGFLFALRRAARDEHQAVRRDAEEAQHALAAASRRRSTDRASRTSGCR